MLIIGIIGPKASGKETIAQYIAKKYAGKFHSHSEILTDVLDVLGLEHSRENEDKLFSLRQTFGPTVLTNALNKKIRAENAALQVVTGIRFQSELENIRSYPNNKVIFVDAPLELRYARQKSRVQKADDQTMTFERFEQQEHHETQLHIAELGKQADFHILNDEDQANLDAQIDDIMKKILDKKAAN